MQNRINDSLPAAKAELRRWMCARLAEIAADELKQADELICQRLRQLPLFNQSATVFAYAPRAGEQDIWPLLQEIIASGRRLCLPRIIGRGLMEARETRDLAELQPDRYGIATPPPHTCLVPPQEIDLILTPGLAFSRDLWRLGYGGGYYDRFMAGCPAFRLALAREIQIVQHIPHNSNDVRMNALLSEAGIWGIDK